MTLIINNAIILLKLHQFINKTKYMKILLYGIQTTIFPHPVQAELTAVSPRHNTEEITGKKLLEWSGYRGKPELFLKYYGLNPLKSSFPDCEMEQVEIKVEAYDHLLNGRTDNFEWTGQGDNYKHQRMRRMITLSTKTLPSWTFYTDVRVKWGYEWKSNIINTVTGAVRRFLCFVLCFKEK